MIKIDLKLIYQLIDNDMERIGYMFYLMMHSTSFIFGHRA